MELNWKTTAMVRRGLMLTPAVLLSTAWTVSVAGVGAGPITAQVPSPAVPAESPAPPSAVPAAEVDLPASVAQFGRRGGRGAAPTTVPAVDGAQIPSGALAAYQRAAAVIGAADQNCHLQWPLVAAIGRIESDHGSMGGSRLDEDGMARPAIIGVRLDGRNDTARISDTDAGRYDGDESFDRAVGPMQFIPSTWAVVGVDADDDGVRNPQDVDDAALASAVYLCSGEVNLTKPADLRRAVRRYNDSERYVDAVLSIMRGYASGAVVPAFAGYVVPAADAAAAGGGDGRAAASEHRAPSQGENSPARPPVREPAVSPTPTPATPATPANPVAAVLSQAQAVVACTLRGLSQLLQPGKFKGCTDELTAD